MSPTQAEWLARRRQGLGASEVAAVQVEEWRPVVGFESLYEVSSLGRVRSLSRSVRRFTCGTINTPARLLKQVLTKHGYWRIDLCRNGQRKVGMVHRLVAEAFYGSHPGLLVRHLDGSRTNNEIANLAWGTTADNEADKKIHGTYYKRGIHRGERHPMAKLTDEQVREIRARYDSGDATQCALAAEYGVRQQHISTVIRCAGRPA